MSELSVNEQGTGRERIDIPTTEDARLFDQANWLVIIRHDLSNSDCMIF